MYLPEHFRVDDRAAQHGLIRAHPLGLLVSADAEGILANHIPFYLDAAAGEHGVLRCHLARANSQWKSLAAGAGVMAVFRGAEEYVTPSWYETKRATGKVVPTWNYAAVHVEGRALVHDNADWVLSNVRELTRINEAREQTPWAVEDAPDAFIKTQLRGIVGVEIAITKLEGKWKVSQNRHEADRAGVAEGLSARGVVSAVMTELVRAGGPAGRA